MTDYYVYALLDPRKPGPFRYGRWVFSHEPFYIGKGQGSRAEFHHRYDVNYNDTHKTRKIKKILRETGMPPIVIYKKLHLSESAAMKFERVRFYPLVEVLVEVFVRIHKTPSFLS
jgi:hypothetical protein